MESPFKSVEEAFFQLKRKFRSGEITRRDFIDRMKKLRLKDSEGRFWMIGAQSGKWYYFDGRDWVQSDPPSLKEEKAICIHCGFENRLDAGICVRCGEDIGEEEFFCPVCGFRLEAPSEECPSCKRLPQEKTGESISTDFFAGKDKGRKWILRSINPVSSLLFLGTSGFFIGVIAGAFAGATNFFSEMVGLMPPFFREIQGNLMGGVIFSCLGGIGGFFVFGIFGLVTVFFLNVALSFVGGVKITLENIQERPEWEKLGDKEEFGED